MYIPPVYHLPILLMKFKYMIMGEQNERLETWRDDNFPSFRAAWVFKASIALTSASTSEFVAASASTLLDSTFDTSLLEDDKSFCNCLMLASCDLVSSCYSSKNGEIKLGALNTSKYHLYFFLSREKDTKEVVGIYLCSERLFQLCIFFLNILQTGWQSSTNLDVYEDKQMKHISEFGHVQTLAWINSIGQIKECLITHLMHKGYLSLT